MMETLNVTHHARIGCDEDAISDRKLEIDVANHLHHQHHQVGGVKI